MTLKHTLLRALFAAAKHRWFSAEFGSYSIREECSQREASVGMAQRAADGMLAEILRTEQIDLVIDVGANAGQFAKRIRNAGFTGRIVSYEPSATPRAELERMAALDTKLHVRPVGVSSRSGDATFNICHDSQFNSVNARAPNIGDLFAASMEVIERVVAPMVRLDDEMEHVGDATRILLKSDTQGHDLAVLEGAQQLLQRIRAVHVELPYHSIYEQAPTAEPIRQALANWGFSLAWIVPIGFGAGARSQTVVECDGLFVRT